MIVLHFNEENSGSELEAMSNALWLIDNAQNSIEQNYEEASPRLIEMRALCDSLREQLKLQDHDEVLVETVQQPSPKKINASWRIEVYDTFFEKWTRVKYNKPYENEFAAIIGLGKYPRTAGSVYRIQKVYK